MSPFREEEGGEIKLNVKVIISPIDLAGNQSHLCVDQLIGRTGSHGAPGHRCHRLHVLTVSSWPLDGVLPPGRRPAPVQRQNSHLLRGKSGIELPVR